MIDNPYWEICKPHVTPSGNNWEGPQVAGLFSVPSPHRGGEAAWRANLDFWSSRADLTSQYSWSIPDPPSVEFVIQHSGGWIIDPIAGTGYWAYLLTQSGVDCVNYDLDPPMPSAEDNHWHRYVKAFKVVYRADAAKAVVSHPRIAGEPDRTLFMSWPPFNTPLAYDILSAYQGDRLIYIGEGAGGCTGDDQFHELLEKEWSEKAHHPIAQWGGIHDHIWVYDRIR